MKMIIAFLFSLSVFQHIYALDIFCRNADDFRKILHITNVEDAPNNSVQVAAHWIDVGESQEGFVARRVGVLENGSISAHQFNDIVFLKSSAISSAVTSASSAYVFGAILTHGLRKFFQGEYICVENGYLEIHSPRNMYDSPKLHAIADENATSLKKKFFRKKDNRNKRCFNLLLNILW